jgi:hypothetical protein
MSFEEVTLLAYIITIVSETVAILLIQKPKNILFWFFTVVLINSFTHPIVMYLLHIKDFFYVPVEAGVIIIEALWYFLAFKINWRRALILSLIANIASIFFGFAIRFLFY